MTHAIEAMVEKNQTSLSPIEISLLICMFRLTASTTFVKVSGERFVFAIDDLVYWSVLFYTKKRPEGIYKLCHNIIVLQRSYRDIPVTCTCNLPLQRRNRDCIDEFRKKKKKF